MKRFFAIVVVGLLLVGCSRPLSAAQCNAIAEHVVDVDSRGVHDESGGDLDTIRKSFRRIEDEDEAECNAGKSYKARDFTCMMAASTTDGIAQCEFAMVRRER